MRCVVSRVVSLCSKNICIVTEDKLDISAICNEVGDPAAGAISTFIGVTRNHFEQKEVLKVCYLRCSSYYRKLEYEAYKPMAEKELTKICDQVRLHWDVKHIAMYHKTGLVPIGEASVIIAISSVHRSESLEAVHFAIDELKATVPIWKKEFYADGSVWKGNAECIHHKRKGPKDYRVHGHHEHKHEHKKEHKDKDEKDDQGLTHEKN